MSAPPRPTGTPTPSPSTELIKRLRQQCGPDDGCLVPADCLFHSSIAALEAAEQREALKDADIETLHEVVFNAQKLVATLRVDKERLEGHIAEYADHRPICERGKARNAAPSGNTRWSFIACTCGFAEARAALASEGDADG